MALRTVAKRLLRLTPYRIERNPRNRFDAMEEFLHHLAAVGYRPALVIDGGAHLGSFALLARAAFPAAEIHMVDPQPTCAAALTALAAQPGLYFHPVALTSANKSVRMVCDGPLDTGAHLAWQENQDRANTDVHGVRLDDLFPKDMTQDKRALLKLDLQGHELLALQGATRLLADVELVISEFSFFNQLGEVSVKDLVRFFDDAGFDLFDIAAVASRRRDNRARHGDLAFVRRQSGLWLDRTWE